MNKLNIENIFLDLDGTSLKTDKTFSSHTINTINDLKKKNINIFIATSRPPYMIKKELNVNENVICVNGGMIINYKENKILEINEISYKLSQKIEKIFEGKKSTLPYLYRSINIF